MTTRTMSEMITITNSTRTAAATVSSERRAKGQERGTGGNLHKFAGGQEGGVAISGLEISLYWWRSIRAAWLIWGMDKIFSQLSTCMKLLQLFPWTGKGQNSAGNTIPSPKVLWNVNWNIKTDKWGWAMPLVQKLKCSVFWKVAVYLYCFGLH